MLAELRHNDDLDTRIAQAKAADEARANKAPAPAPRGQKQGARVLMELIGTPAGGAILGLAIDYWAKTAPWAFVIFFSLAIVVAFRNIYRISKERAE